MEGGKGSGADGRGGKERGWEGERGGNVREGGRGGEGEGEGKEGTDLLVY